MRPHLSELTEAIYDAAVTPAAWSQVMRLMKDRFATEAEALYGLDLHNRGLRALHLEGIESPFIRCFTDLFYTDDNPCIRSEPLHRPGVVRTDQRLLAFFRDPGVLRRSQYYNEWMRPQALEHSMGVTLHADDSARMNLTLFRPCGRGPYEDAETGDFTWLSTHLQRSFRLAAKLGSITSLQRVSVDLLDAHAAGVLLLDEKGRLAYANCAALAITAEQDGLEISGTGLRLTRHSDNQKIARLIRRAAEGESGGAMTALRPSGKRGYAITVSRLSRGNGIVVAGPAICIMIADPEAEAPLPRERLRQLYGLTPAEAALAIRLASGDDLREAGERLGIRYSTARAQLTIIFRKTETRRQGELIKLLLSAAALPYA